MLSAGIGPQESLSKRLNASAQAAGLPKPTVTLEVEGRDPPNGSAVESPSMISAREKECHARAFLKPLTKLTTDKSSDLYLRPTIKVAHLPTPDSYRHRKKCRARTNPRSERQAR